MHPEELPLVTMDASNYFSTVKKDANPSTPGSSSPCCTFFRSEYVNRCFQKKASGKLHTPLIQAPAFQVFQNGNAFIRRVTFHSSGPVTAS